MNKLDGEIHELTEEKEHQEMVLKRALKTLEMLTDPLDLLSFSRHIEKTRNKLISIDTKIKEVHLKRYRYLTEHIKYIER